MGIRIELGEDEPISKALRRLKTLLSRYKGPLYVCRQKMYREKPCQIRRLKKGKAKIRKGRTSYLAKLRADGILSS